MTNCDACVNYEYDEDYECYCCMVNLDEDEMYRFLSGSRWQKTGVSENGKSISTCTATHETVKIP